MLQSPNSPDQGMEEVSRVAATLYLEMKKSLKTRNVQTCNEGIQVIKEMHRQGQIPGNSV